MPRDVDGPALTAVNLAIASGKGTLVNNPDGTWTYTPALNDDTAVTFTYAVSDGMAAPVATTASLDITPVNDAPVTSPVTLTAIAEDSGPRLITQAELLANATDVDGPALTAVNLAISVRQGHAGQQPDGTWSYTPAANDDTSVTFSYAVSDGIAAPVATTRQPRHHAGERRAGDEPGDADGDCRGQRAAADHAGRAAGQCQRRGRAVADRGQPADQLRQGQAGQQSRRHLDLSPRRPMTTPR